MLLIKSVLWIYKSGLYYSKTSCLQIYSLTTKIFDVWAGHGTDLPGFYDNVLTLTNNVNVIRQKRITLIEKHTSVLRI